MWKIHVYMYALTCKVKSIADDSLKHFWLGLQTSGTALVKPTKIIKLYSQRIQVFQYDNKTTRHFEDDKISGSQSTDIQYATFHLFLLLPNQSTDPS